MIKNTLLSQWFVIIPTVRISVTKRRFEANPIEYSSGVENLFTTIPESLLRIVRIGVANSNRSEFSTEWALPEPLDFVNSPSQNVIIENTVNYIIIKLDFNPFLTSSFK